MKIIKNSTIYTMENKNLEHGYIIVNDGIITQVDDMKTYDKNLEKNASEVFDASGMYCVPGFVDAHCHIGMWEDGVGFEGDDGNEDTDPATPQLRAVDAINPMENSFKEAYEAGVTTVVTGPGSANPIGGQIAAVKTYGVRIDDMIVKAPVAVKVAFGENPKTVYHGKNQTPSTRMATASILREYFHRTKEYLEAKEKHFKNPKINDSPDFDMKLEALIPVVKGEIPIHAHAHRSDDMFTAIRIAREFGVKLVLVHCTEGHLAADILAKEKVSVLVGPSLCERSKPELKHLTFETPGVLCNVGLSTAIITDHPAIPIRYLSLCAMLAVKAGMDYTDALASITINAAKNVGIDDKVGSIKVGKDSDIVIFDGEPLNFYSKITKIFTKF